MIEEKDFEKLLKEKFSEFEEIPSEKVWNGVQRRLSWNDFFHFSINSFNIYYVAVLVTALVGGVIVFSGNEDNVKDNKSLHQADSIHKDTIIPEDVIKNKLSEISLTHLESQKLIPETKKMKPVEVKTPVVLKEKEFLPNDKTVTAEPVREDTLGGGIPVQTKELKLKAAFRMSSKTGCGPLKVEFQNISGNAINYTWNFGDGVVSNQRNPVYLFDKPGTWIVQLNAADLYGNISTAYDTVVIKSMPKAQFEFVTKPDGVSDGLVYFYNYSRNSVQYLWDFGDGNTSDQINPIYTYKRRDDYRVKLVAYSEQACSDTLVSEEIFPGTDYFIRFPNAFSPNVNSPGDGRYNMNDISNQVFFPVSDGVAEYRLNIYNRAGLQVFESNDIQVGWNGYYRGQLVKPDVYIWKVNGKYINGKPFVLGGDVTVIIRK